MRDLKYILRYAKPYRKSITAAVLLVFAECIFEMAIPLLMTDIVDIGVANRDVAFLLRQDCFVRVTAFAPVALTYNAPDGGWTEMVDENDKNVSYWCYDDVLPAGKTTEQELNITYKFPEGDDKPEEFNIVVIQECTPVLYDNDGTPYADWNHVIKDDSTQTTE